MNKLSASLFLMSAILVVSTIGLLGPMYGVHLNIKQAVAIEVLYLIASCILGYTTSEFSEGLAKLISAFGGFCAAIGLQLLVVAVYWLYQWIMS